LRERHTNTADTLPVRSQKSKCSIIVVSSPPVSHFLHFLHFLPVSLSRARHVCTLTLCLSFRLFPSLCLFPTLSRSPARFPTLSRSPARSFSLAFLLLSSLLLCLSVDTQKHTDTHTYTHTLYMYIYTHTHRNTDARTCTHTHMNTHTHMYIRIDTHTCIKWRRASASIWRFSNTPLGALPPQHRSKKESLSLLM